MQFKKKLSLLKIGIIAAVLLPSSALFASEENDFDDMSLDDLSDYRVFAASVISAHIHQEGDIMFSYDYSSMKMSGSASGSSDISNENIMMKYMSTPTEMTMNMHMFHLMYAPRDDLTLAIMAMYADKEMDILYKLGMNDMGGMGGMNNTPMLGNFSTQSKGWTDTTVRANYVLSRSDLDFGEQEIVLTAGLSIPTGSINQKDFNPMMAMTARLPYPMQLGSGTYDIEVGALYGILAEGWYSGIQGIAKIRGVGSSYNDNDYRLGDSYQVKAWFNKSVTDNSSAFIQLEAHQQDSIHGADPMLNPIMSPTADPSIRKRKELNAIAGFEIELPQNSFGSSRVTFEYSMPLYENFAGPQLKTKSLIKVGIQSIF